MKIAFIGSGNVGGALAHNMQKAGHEVTLAKSGEGSDSIAKAVARNPALKVAPVKEAVAAADVVFLATPFGANEAALAPIADELAGKILVDCTNPVGPGLSHGLESKMSGSQKVQSLAPKAHVVKAFTIYGFENFENSSYPNYNSKPAMLFCGNDAAAKSTVATLIEQLGWKPVDVGGIDQALHLEHMTLLWVRMVRVKGHSPHFVWSMLER